MTEASEKYRTLIELDLVAIASFPFAHLGLEFAVLRTAQNRFFRICAAEDPQAHFDAYSVDVVEEDAGSFREAANATPSGLASSGWRDEARAFRVGSIELFRQDQWRERCLAPWTTFGTDPMVPMAGPVGSAPAGVECVTVVWGLALHPRDPSVPPLLYYTNPYPTVISSTRDRAQLAEYRANATTEMLAA